jgi:hypothetical protein
MPTQAGKIINRAEEAEAVRNRFGEVKSIKSIIESMLFGRGHYIISGNSYIGITKPYPPPFQSP